MTIAGARRGGGAKLNRTRTVALTLVLVLAASTALAAPFGDPVDARGEPAAFVPVYVGTDARFAAGGWTGEPPADALPFNWAYEGGGTTEEDCVHRYFGGCITYKEAGWFYAESYMFWDAPRGVVDERAGVGVAYELLQRCDGQALSRPMWANFTWTPEEAETNRVTTSNAGGGLSIWGNAVDGRGGVLGELRDPIYGGDAPGYNTLFEEYVQPNPSSGSTYAEYDPRQGSIRVDAPALGENAALLYVHAHSEKAGVSGLAISTYSAVLDELTLDFHDATPPAAWINVTRPDGSAVAPAAVAGGYKWYREAVRTSYDADDVESCPKDVLIEDTGATHAFGYNKTPAHVDKTTDGKWNLTALFGDHAGNSVWGLERIGVDTVAPGVDATASHAPDGANGWYRTPSGVTFTLACTDATSGCAGGSYAFTSGPSGNVASFPAVTASAPQGVSTLSCTARDVSGLVGAGCGQVVMYDRTAPTPAADCAPSRTGTVPCAASVWLREPATVTLRCNDAGGSNAANGDRCWHLNHTLDGGPEVSLSAVASATLTVTGEGAHTVGVTMTDHAGNAASRTYNFSIDALAPTKPSILLENDDADHVINVAPRWSFSATDALSGVHEYRVYLNGAYSHATTNGYTLTQSEGMQCARVAAVDKAGNQGPLSDESCVFADRSLPSTSIASPQWFWVYKDATPWFYASNQISLAMVLGDVRFTTWAQDAPGKPSSGLASHVTLLNGADWTPVEGSNACTPPGAWCNHTYPISAGRGWKTFNVRASDVAGNVATHPHPVRTAVTDHVAYSASTPFGTTHVPYVESHWKSPVSLTRVEVHRFNLQGFTPTPATRQANLAGDVTSWRDTLVAPDTPYYYKLVGYASAGGVESAVWTSVEYPVRTVDNGYGSSFPYLQELPSNFS